MSSATHTPQPTPPRPIPPVLERIKTSYATWLTLHRNFPKSERYGLGQKVDTLFIALLETIHRASFAAGSTKLDFLGQALITVDLLRFFLQVCWENRLIPTTQYAVIGQEVESIGRMIGGWRKGMHTKTSPPAPK